MKKILSMTLALLLVLGLTACGIEQTAHEQTTDDGEQTITFWYMDKKLMTDPLEKRVAEFNKLYEGKYNLVYEWIPRGNAYAYEDKVNTAASANMLPDILALDGPNLANYVSNGLLIPLDDYVTAKSKADMMPSLLVQNTYEGKLYAIGLNEATCGLFYNKDIFEANGFRIPTSIDDAYTWSEIYEMAKKVSTPEVVGIKLILDKGEGIPYVFSSFWVGNGSAFTSEDGSKCNGYINNAKGVETATYLQRFFNEKLANIDPTPTEFQDGKAAMWLANIAEIAGIEKNYPDLNWGVTYMPKPDNGVMAAPCGSWTVGITRDCKDPEAAFVALDFLTNSESTRVYMDESGFPGARISNYQDNKKWDSEPLNAFKTQLFEAAVPRPRTPVYTVLSPKFSETMLDIFTGSDPKESLDALAEFVDAQYVKATK